MINFVEKLEKEVRRKIKRIESEDRNILKKSLDASHVLGDAFDQLKEFITGYSFKDEAEEILFFKEIKPRLFSHLIYYRKVYNIEIGRPVASVDAQREYLKRELDYIQKYHDKIIDFYRYYRSGATHRDATYFVRGKPEIEQYLDTFYYERDSELSAIANFYKVARIMANDMLQAYFMTELEALNDYNRKPVDLDLPNVRLTWTGTKTELIELIYALDTTGSFNHGKVSLAQIAAYFQSVFNIDLRSVYRNFYDMRLRQQPTPFLDRLRDEIRKRMEDFSNEQKKKNNNK